MAGVCFISAKPPAAGALVSSSSIRLAHLLRRIWSSMPVLRKASAPHHCLTKFNRDIQAVSLML